MSAQVPNSKKYVEEVSLVIQGLCVIKLLKRQTPFQQKLFSIFY